MKPVRFDYARPSDVGAAVISPARSESAAVKFLAGGQSLGPFLNLRLVQPDLVVDITGIEELKRIEETADGVTIGSCSITHADVEDGRVRDVTGGPLRAVVLQASHTAPCATAGRSAEVSCTPTLRPTGFPRWRRSAPRP